ncbi:MAG: DUF2442 domain-containing protein [Candidatus Aureabacteria bacterium]|nr:DUF2442 domain-containing protein [Candidatus Auribacterota bacterium]
MKKYHKIEDVQVDEKRIILKVDGKKYVFELSKVSGRLAAATLAQRLHFEVSASGYGIHWPEIDEDLSIDGLLGVVHTTPMQKATV